VVIDQTEARRRGTLETAAGADGIVRSAQRAGLTELTSAHSVFAAAAAGDQRAVAVVIREARLVAAAICCVIAVVDPSLIVLGGGIGQAPASRRRSPRSSRWSPRWFPRSRSAPLAPTWWWTAAWLRPPQWRGLS